MEDDEEALSFVEQLANDLLLRLGRFESFDKAVIWEFFDTSVVALENVNPELMSYLTENRKTYGKKLVKLAKSLARKSCNMQTALSSVQKSDAQPLPYNLYASNKVQKETVQDHYSDTCSIYSAYLRERMVHLKDSKAVLKLLKHCVKSPVISVQGSWLLEIRKLCAIASTQTDAKVLQLVMEIFNMRLSSELECRSCNEEWLSDIKSTVEDFVTFCSRKHEQVGEFPKRPRFCDLLAATMSMYTDVVLLSCRKKSETDQEKEGKRLCGSVCSIFRDHPEFILDVVIQLSECQSSDGTILVPLCKKALAKPMGNMDSVFYTKYMVASNQCRRLFPQLMSDTIVQVRDVAAPADYVNWLKEKKSSIPEVFPTKKHFSNFQITKFLLEKATDDILNKLLDVLKDANVATEENRDHIQTTSENEMFVFDRASSSKNAGFLPVEDVEMVEPQNDNESADVEDQGDITLSLDGKAVQETDIVICFDRGSAMAPESLGMSVEEQAKETTNYAEQKQLVCDDGHEEETDESDKFSSQEEIIVENIDENATSSDEVVEKDNEKGVHTTYSVALLISDESEDEESHEVLINRVLDCINIGDTSDSDMFEEWDDIAQKDTGCAKKRTRETVEQSHKNVETECGDKGFEDKLVKAETSKLGFKRSILQEDSKSPKIDVEPTSSKLKDETEFSIDRLEVNEKIRSPDSSNTSAVISKNKRKSGDQNIIKCTKEKASNAYTVLKSGERSPGKSTKDQENNWRDSDIEISVKSPRNRSENRGEKKVEDCPTDMSRIKESTVVLNRSDVKILEGKEISISTLSDNLDSPKSQNHSFVEPKQLQQGKSTPSSLRLPSSWSSKRDCSTPQSPTATLNRTIVTDSSERCSAKSPKNLTHSPRLPDFKKFLKSPGKITDEYEFDSDIDKSPLLPFTRLAKGKDSAHGDSSLTQPMEKTEKGCNIFEGATGSRNSVSPEAFTIALTYSRGGKRSTIRKDLLSELGDVRQSEISQVEDVLESPPATPAKADGGVPDAEGRSGSEDPDGHLARRRSVRLQNKLSVAAKDSTQFVPLSPVVNSRKRKASGSTGTPKKLKS